MARSSTAKRFGRLVGNSPPMKRLFKLIDKAAGVDLPVLITGETGVGKDLVANEIHERSQRAQGPFVALNLGTLSKELMVSELFGHKRGAFTGAGEPKAGRFAEANTGTLFLDEISTAHEQVQVALLRVLDTAKFRPIGAKRDRKVDVRIIAATNETLREAVVRGEFRADLLHRFEVLHLQVPALRQRKRDIRALSLCFLEQVNKEFHFEIEDIAKETIEEMLRYPWPGNVRELKNVIAHAAVVAERGVLRPEHLPARVMGLEEGKRLPQFDQVPLSHGPQAPASVTPMELSPDGVFLQEHGLLTVPLGLTIDELQKAYVLKTLAACGQNKTQAARQLGISRKTLYDRLTRWGIS